MAAILLLVGAVLIVVGATFVYWPLGVLAAGFLSVAAGVDLTRREAS